MWTGRVDFRGQGTVMIGSSYVRTTTVGMIIGAPRVDATAEGRRKDSCHCVPRDVLCGLADSTAAAPSATWAHNHCGYEARMLDDLSQNVSLGDVLKFVSAPKRV